MSSIKFHSYLGLGDQVYMRPFVIEALNKYTTVDLVTPFPDLLYAGQGVRCIKTQTNLKTQAESIKNSNYRWKTNLPNYNKALRLNYSVGFHKNLNVIQSFREQTGLNPKSFQFDIPQEYKDAARAKIKTDKPICYLRLPTIRSEWMAQARNAKMEYFQPIIDRLKNTHYIVSCLDLRDGKEWLDGELPKGIDLCLHNAELNINEAVGLMAISSCIVGIQCNIIPLSCAFDVPCFVVYGGYVSHEALHDPFMGNKIRHVQPDPFCFCINGRHNCNKDIGTDRLIRTFENFKKDVLCLKKLKQGIGIFQ